MNPAESVNILLVDDHQLVIDGLRSLLSTEKQYVITAEANDGAAALDIIKNTPGHFNLVISDISMPLMDGVALCSRIKQQFPEIKVLILSMYNNITAVKEAVAAEADGYILKNTGKEELLKAIHRITDGGTYFSQDILPILYNQYNKERKQVADTAILTQREREILTLILKEKTSEEIAQHLFISKKTVDNHRANILEKTNCKSTIGLVKYAIKNGFE